MNYSHFLITRFNVKSPFGEDGIIHNEIWLNERIVLFERYCLPSIRSQRQPCLNWLVCFDERTPVKFLFPFIQLYRREFVPVFCPSQDWKAPVRRLINSWSHPSEMIVTTRLDSDDALKNDFFEKLYLTLEHHGVRAGAYDTPFGWAYHTGNRTVQKPAIDYHAHPRALSPFFTLVEPYSDKPLTALGVDHGSYKSSVDYLVIETEPSWLQVIHGGNAKNVASNIIHAAIRPSEFLETHFGVKV